VLLTNGSAIQTRFLADSLRALAPLAGVAAYRRYTNAGTFGNDTSWPQGYTQVTRAWIPPLAASGQIAARLSLSVDLTANLGAAANMTVSIPVSVDMSADANVRSNMSTTVAVSVEMSAGIRADANMATTFDLVGRPSAVDISQEVWNGFTVENGLSGADVMRILLAAMAGKVSGAATTTINIRDNADTKNRIVATVDADGNRSAVTLDAST
jgi:hypothetical protein